MNGQRTVKIGAVNYLNTTPLVYGLETLAPHAEVVYDLPSRLADRLASAELDVALIPSIEYFQNPSYTVVSDACIGCRGPVLSVKLFSRTPVDRIRTLALDTGRVGATYPSLRPMLRPSPPTGFTRSAEIPGWVFLQVE